MANIKITDLTAYGDPDSTDVLPIVDVGADVTKKVSVADLLENAGSGTAAAPGIAFDGDPNTGIYRPGADQLAISTNGVQRINFQADGDINIDSGGVFYDATNNRLAIGTTSPSSLDPGANNLVVGSGSGAEGITIYTGNASRGIINFADGTTGVQTYVGQVAYDHSANALTFGTSAAERARIDSSGRLLVGTSSAFNTDDQALLQVSSVGNTSISLLRSDATIVADNPLGEFNFLADDESNSAEICASIIAKADGTHANGDRPTRLEFSVTANGSATPTEAMRIKNTRIINIANTPVYADNAAAKTGGLVDGDVYRTSTGDLKIVYT